MYGYLSQLQGRLNKLDSNTTDVLNASFCNRISRKVGTGTAQLPITVKPVPGENSSKR